MFIILLTSFVFYFILSVYFFEGLKGRDRTIFFALSCAIVALIIGMRNPLLWSDSAVYYEDFILNAKSVSELNVFSGPGAYSEKGFYYIGVIAKTIYNNSTFYFILVSAITMLILYKAISDYSLFPFFALFLYLGRFVARNTVQIRAAVAIAIVMLGTAYITKRQWWKYLLVLFIAYEFHKSVIISAALCVLCFYNIKKWHVYFLLAMSYLIAGLYGGIVKSYVSSIDLVNEWAYSYIQDGSEKAWSNDLTNPMIWYQSFILIVFTYYEEVFNKITPHYYTLRNAYLYSTMILIILCQYATLAARLSTIFATYEMIIVPMFFVLFKKQNSFVPYALYCIVFTFFFYMNNRSYF